MKSIFLFILILLFGFFDFFLFCSLFCLFLFFLFFELGGLWFGGFFFCDSLSFFLVYLSSLIFVFCLFSSLPELWGKNFFWSFFFVLSSIFFLLLICFLTFSVFLFYLFFESVFMLMYFFVLGWGGSPERLQASFYMVFYTLVVSFPFLFYLTFYETFIFSMKFLSFFSFSSYWWFFLFFVFLVKLPVYGVHLWLPKAHVEAPVSGSMVLAGVLLKLGGYGFIRLSFFSSASLCLYGGYFYSVGLLGGLFSCFLCLRQVDLKAFVAYSSICHMGLCVSGIFSGVSFGVVGAIYMLIAHGLCCSCLFYILYVFYERSHSRSLLLVKGVGLLVPTLIFIWFVFSALNMGVPPSFSFFSEICLLVGLGNSNFNSLVFVSLFLFFAGLYGIFFYSVSCHGTSLLSVFNYGAFSREFLNMFGHFPPMLFVPFFLSYFYT